MRKNTRNLNAGNRFYRKLILEAQTNKSWNKQTIITGIVMPLILGFLAFWQANLLSSQQQQIKGFDSLLRTTNELNIGMSNQLKTLQSQLEISQVILANNLLSSENSKIGNGNTFAAAVYSLGELLTNFRDVQAYTEDPEQYLIKQAKPILESQMSNPFLVQNKQVMAKWIEAYRNTCAFIKSPFSTEFSDEFGGSGNTRLKEISKNIKTDFKSCQNSIDLAFKAGAEYIRNNPN